MNTPNVPEFAVLGHPNEGKSSLVSTLSEDDTVRISPYPGETTRCRAFPVVIDGREILRFTDTPGFQNPRQTLDWFEGSNRQGLSGIHGFIEEHRSNPMFRDECELFAPLARGAFIIFVVDGSRPIRSNDRAEMTILGLTALPRVAVINHKTDNTGHTEAWKKELALHFPVVTVFNAHLASYGERLRLLTELRPILPPEQVDLETVIEVFRKEWGRRNSLSAEHIVNLLDKALSHSVKIKMTDKSQKDKEKKRLQELWASQVRNMETETHQSIRALFKHNIFDVDLPAHSLSAVDLFDKETWKVLGMNRKELAASTAALGAAAAATFDLALVGHSLGLFTVIGGLAGAGSALLGARRLGNVRVLGKTLGAYTLKAGPRHDLQFMMVLLDRALIFYSHIINWAHGRRTDEKHKSGSAEVMEKQGFVSGLSQADRRELITFFNSLANQKKKPDETARKRTFDTIVRVLDHISKKGNESGVF